MSRWSPEQLAQQLSRNSHVRVAQAPGKASPPKVQQPRRPKRTLTVQEAIAGAMREAELQENVRQQSILTGWLYYHTHRSQHSPAGFPDTVCIRITGGDFRLLFAELKREDENPSDAQQEWLSKLTEFSKRISQLSRFTKGLGFSLRLDVFVWRPTQWLDGTIEKALV